MPHILLGSLFAMMGLGMGYAGLVQSKLPREQRVESPFMCWLATAALLFVSFLMFVYLK